MNQLSGQVAIVTGASRGIGRGIAMAFVRAGASLVLTSRDQAALDHVVAGLPGCVEAFALAGDIADEQFVAELFREAKARFRRLDLLVNNAGAFDGGPLDQFSIAAWDRVIATNLRGPFLCTREALQIMKPQQFGRIINIGSISAQRVRPNSAAYSASKHGIWGLTQVTALEGRDYGVTCCCLHPGNIAVERRQTREKQEDAEPMMTVDEIASVALLMATLPPHVAMLEAIVLPRDQLYVGRG